MITAIAVIRNEAPYLVQYFEHVKRFCDEIIILDQQSTDASAMISKQYADRVFISPNVGWNEMDKEWLVNQAKNDWVCYLDPDEMFAEETINSLPKIIEKANKEECDAVSFKVKMFWDGIYVTTGDIQQCRLAKKGITGSQRIHSNFTPKKELQTNLFQYHFKESEKHIERLTTRQKLDYEQRIKDNELEFLNNVTSEVHVKQYKWDKIREHYLKDIKKEEYVELQ